MWSVTSVDSGFSDDKTLIATLIDHVNERYHISMLRLHHSANNISFMLCTKNDPVQHYMNGIKARLQTHYHGDSHDWATTIISKRTNTMHFSCSIANDYYILNNILQIIYQYAPQLKVIQSKLPWLIAVSKSSIIRTNSVAREHAAGEFENHVENVMSSFLLGSAIESELRLRQIYQLPTDMQDDTVILTMVEELTTIQNSLISEGFLKHQENSILNINVILTEHTKNLFQNQNSNTDLKSIEKMQLALEITPAIRSVINGIYSRDSEHFKLLNLAIFFYSVCQQAASNTNGFMPGVTYNDAIRALVKGLYSGQRQKNINNDTNIDNLQTDLSACYHGSYVELVEAFNGILPQVNIFYDYIGILLEDLKYDIVNILMKTPDINLPTATTYLNIWEGKQAEPDNKQEQYYSFKQEVLDAFHYMINDYLSKHFNNCMSLMERMRGELNKHINDMKNSSYSENYIELVIPSLTHLQKAWSIKERLEQQEHITPGNKRQRLVAG